MFNCVGKKTAALLLAASFAESAFFAGVPAVTFAQAERSFTFNITAKPVASAISELAAVTGLNIVFPQANPVSVNASPVSGRMTAGQAIAVLLKGSGLTHRYVDAETIVISDGNAARNSTAGTDGATVLEPITLWGDGYGRFNGDQAAAYDTAQSTFVLDVEEIERFRGSSPADLLRGIPGVTVGEARTGGAIDPNIRGMQGQDRVKVTVDGTESTFDAHRGYAGRQQRNYVDPDLISGLKVTKGPSVHGGAIGGSIDMMTLRPDDILLEGNDIGVRIKGGVASNSSTPGTRFDAPLNTDVNSIFEPQSGYGNFAFAARKEGFDVVAAYSKRNNANYFSGRKGRESYRIFHNGDEQNSVARFYPEESEVLNTSSLTESVLLKATLRPFDDHTLDFSYRWSDGNYGEIMPSNVIRNSTGYIPQWEPAYMNSDNFSTRYNWNPADNDLINLTANFGYSHLYYNGYSSTFNSAPSDKPFCEGDADSERCYKQFYGLRRNIEKYNADIKNTSEFDTALGNIKVTLGTGLNFDRLFPPDDAPSMEKGNQLSGGRHQEGDRWQSDTFGSLEWQPLDAITVNLGGRFTRFKTRDKYARSESRYVDETHRPVQFTREWTEYTGRFDRRTGKQISVPVIRSESGVAVWLPDAEGNFTAATDPRLNGNSAVSIEGLQKRTEKLSDFKPTKSSVGEISARRVKQTFDAGRLSREDSGFAPSIGGSYEFIEGWKVHASYTHGIRMPGLIESVSGTTSTYVRGGLEPEEARNLEIALSTRAENAVVGGDTVMAKLAYFDNKTKNYITRHGVLLGELDIYSQTFYNADLFRVKGLEFQSAYDAGGFFANLSVTHNISAVTCDVEAASMSSAGMWFSVPNCVNGGFSGSFTNAQNPPKYAVSATLGARFLDETLTLGGRISHTSGPISELNSLANRSSGTATQLFYKPYTLVDLFASYEISKNARFDLAAENIFDRYYLDPLSLSTMPGPGRTIKASLTVKF